MPDRASFSEAYRGSSLYPKRKLFHFFFFDKVCCYMFNLCFGGSTIRDALMAQLFQCVLDRLPLGVEHGSLGNNVDMSLHRARL